MFALIMAAFTFTSCEDVPQPYQTPESGNDTPTVEEVATGDGTAANPFNAVAANKNVEAGEGLDKTVYLTGIISSVKECSAQYGNASFYITEDGSTTKTSFYVYRVKGLGNNKIDSDDYVKVGDKVVVCAQLTNYNGTYETAQNTGYIYSLNGNTDGDTTPDEGKATGDGTKENPYNSIAANEYTSSLAADVNSDKEIYIKGKVVSVKEQYGTQYGNATFYISDDGKEDNQFYVFRALYLDNKKYTEGTTLKAGDEVVVCGLVVNYKGNTPETVQGKAYLVSLKSNGESGDNTDDTTGDTSAANGDFECWVSGAPNNWKSSSSAGNATLSQSTDAHGGKYSVKVTGNSSGNKRMAYKEMELKAGEYTMTFYAKAATSTGASLCPGYAIVTDGNISSSSDYKYGDYTNNLTNTEWVKVSHTFTIAADGTYCVLIMNSKNPGGDLLIDDFTLTCGSQTIIK